MAQSKCACGSSSFEMKEIDVRVPAQGPTVHKYMAIQCSQCGIVVGTHEGFYPSSVLSLIAEKLGIRLS